MKAHANEIQQRFNFIDRTLTHARQACESDASVPDELKKFIQQLDRQYGQAKQALHSNEENLIQKSVDDLALLSDRVQKSIPRPSNVNYEVKSAVIMAHLEIAALRYQVH